MMRKLKAFLLAILTVAVMGSCTLETSGNGNLDGFWHLVTVDSLGTGGTLDLSGERLYWSFQGNLLSHRDANGRCKELISYFEFKGDSLFVAETFYYDRTNGDPKVNDVSDLKPYGMNELNESFSVLHLDGSYMVLCSDELRLYFKKM